MINHNTKHIFKITSFSLPDPSFLSLPWLVEARLLQRTLDLGCAPCCSLLPPPNPPQGGHPRWRPCCSAGSSGSRGGSCGPFGFAGWSVFPSAFPTGTGTGFCVPRRRGPPHHQNPPWNPPPWWGFGSWTRCRGSACASPGWRWGRTPGWEETEIPGKAKQREQHNIIEKSWGSSKLLQLHNVYYQPLQVQNSYLI